MGNGWKKLGAKNLGKPSGTRKSGRGNKPQYGISLRTNNISLQLIV